MPRTRQKPPEGPQEIVFTKTCMVRQFVFHAGDRIVWDGDPAQVYNFYLTRKGQREQVVPNTKLGGKLMLDEIIERYHRSGTKERGQEFLNNHKPH